MERVIAECCQDGRCDDTLVHPLQAHWITLNTHWSTLGHQLLQHSHHKIIYCYSDFGDSFVYKHISLQAIHAHISLRGISTAGLGRVQVLLSIYYVPYIQGRSQKNLMPGQRFTTRVQSCMLSSCKASCSTHTHVHLHMNINIVFKSALLLRNYTLRVCA